MCQQFTFAPRKCDILDAGLTRKRWGESQITKSGRPTRKTGQERQTMSDKIKAYKVYAVTNPNEGGVFHLGYWDLPDKCGCWCEMAEVYANLRDAPEVVAVVKALQAVVNERHNLA